MRIGLIKTFFLGALWLAAFGYGAATVHCRIFPFPVLSNAGKAWRALLELVEQNEERKDDADARDVQGLAGPIVRRHSEAAGHELILVAGGPGYLDDENPPEGCLAWIMDRQGVVKHLWCYDPRTWEKLEKCTAVPGTTPETYPVGLHLYEDGSLLASFQVRDAFPGAVGLARFDKDSKLLWKKELFNHHWFTVGPDGRIFALSVRIVDSPYTIGATRFALSSADGIVREDLLMILDRDGNVLEEISLLDALIESGWQGLLHTEGATQRGTQASEQFLITSGDPTHLNGVELVDAKLAAAHPWLNEGDLLIWMRHTNAVGILDVKTRRFKWMSAGTTIQQHSPHFYEDGVLLLDNRGGPAARGGSQMVRIDLETRLPQVVFPLASVALPGEFYTIAAGQFDLCGPDRALVALTYAQKIWEINLKTGEVLWEYLYADRQHRRREIWSARYVSPPRFSMNKLSASHGGSSPGT